MTKKISILLTSFVFISCSSKSPKDNSVLIEANRIHLEAEAIQSRVEPEIEKIDSLKNLLQLKKMAKADSLASELVNLKTDFKDWEKNLFVVPGFEHTHEGKHAHNHHEHTPAPELPADKMLEIQKEIKINIERIDIELNKKLAQTKEILK
ncbi:MAG TPA: hypothetical protein VGE24_03240 [Emticicia sp.]